MHHHPSCHLPRKEFIVNRPTSASRRHFLAATLSGSAGLLLPRILQADEIMGELGSRGSSCSAPVVPLRMNPSEALDRLREGNARMVTGRGTGPNRGLDRISAVGPSKAPFAAILGCADSWVPPELLFDQGHGDLLVVRVAGSEATHEELASLEFGVAALGAAFILVLGHSECGAVKAAMSPEIPPDQISTLYQHIVTQVLLQQRSPLLAQFLREGRVGIGAGVYDLATGRVELLNTVGV